MSKKKDEQVVLRVRIELPPGSNAKMALDFVRDCLEYGKNEIANTQERHGKMGDANFYVALQQRITNYG